MLSALLPTSEFPAEIRRAILSKAAGNPLFLEELGRLLRSGDATDALLAGDDSRNRIAEVIPVTLAELIRARMDRLDARTRHVLQCMSVLGLEFSVNALGLFDGIADQLSEQLHFLRVAGYIDHLPDPNGLRYFFVHGRLQEEAYASLRSDQREALHQRIARRLEGWLGDRLPTYFEELAWHFEQGGEPERASYYLVKAGDRRAGLGAGAGALESYRQATRLLEEQVATTPRSTLMARLLLRSARLHRDRGENDLADEMIASALILATNLENPHLVLEVRLEEAMSGVWKGGEGGQEAALSGLAEDARRLGHGSAELAAQNALGVRLLRAGRHEEALEVLQKVARLAEQQDVPHLLADAFNNAGLVYWRWGELQQALRAFRKALPLRRRTEDRSGLAATLMNMGIIHEQLGEVKAAVTSYRKSGDLARSVGHVQALAAVECNLSNLARRTGGLIGALEHAILSVRFSREVGDRNFESMAAENAGLALMELGRYPEARQQFSAALGLAHDVGNEEQEIATRLSLAELGLREGAEAAAVLGDCEEVARLVEERKYHDLLPRAMRLKGLAMEATASADSGPRSLECLEGACERARSQGNVFETLEAVRALMRWAEHHRETEKAGSYRREVESLMGLVEVSWE